MLRILRFAFLLLFLLSCGRVEISHEKVPLIAFRDVSTEVGLDFQYFNGMSGKLYISEIMGGSVAVFDFDNDGDLDVYFGQGHMLGDDLSHEQASVPPLSGPPFLDRIFRNDLDVDSSGNKKLQFVDVTAKSGLEAGGYSMGVTTGDFDNDGWVDLYVTNHGANQLWHNNGDGTFTDTTEVSGAGDTRWSTSAAAVDYDRDGWLDLFIVNYIDFELVKNVLCLSSAGLADYCSPHSYTALPDRLLHNNGDGTFEDVSLSSGIASLQGHGLGVTVLDANQDGWLDFYVANDLMRNYLWMNKGDGSFKNESLYSGCAVDASGQGQSSMGVDCGDVDNDLDEDIVVAHMVKQTNTLYLNDGSGIFLDASMSSGLGPPSFVRTAYSTVFLDFDRDGWLDMFAANGSMIIIPEQAAAGLPYPLLEPDQLFKNVGDGRFVEVSESAPVFADAAVGRGSAIGDLDNDGDIDIVVSNSNGPARLLLNQVCNETHWLGLSVVDGSPPRDMLGARVTVKTTGNRRFMRRVRNDGSYCSAGDPRVFFGLGTNDQPVDVEVLWPDGAIEVFSKVAVDQYSTLVRGSN